MANFIQNEIDEDLKKGKYTTGIHTRFPPEPNGYLHVGHAKSICLNFGLAEKNNGLCNLRFDDTNPTKEDVEYVDSIQEDIRWLGFSWGNRKFYASDYFDKLYDYAEQLIRKGLAYVDDLSAEEIKAYRGTLTEPGKESPYRNRSVEENLDLFRAQQADLPVPAAAVGIAHDTPFRGQHGAGHLGLDGAALGACADGQNFSHKNLSSDAIHAAGSGHGTVFKMVFPGFGPDGLPDGGQQLRIVRAAAQQGTQVAPGFAGKAGT